MLLQMLNVLILQKVDFYLSLLGDIYFVFLNIVDMFFQNVAKSHS